MFPSLRGINLDLLPSLELRNAFMAVIACASAVHLIYKTYEPTKYTLTFLLLICTPSLCSSFLVPHFSSILAAYFLGFISFYGWLLTSIALYRVAPWHPLAKYPGPIAAKLSKLWAVFVILRGDQKRTYLRLHKTFGPIVRIGPNELSIAEAELIPALFAPDMPKGPVWQGRVNPDVPPAVVATRSSKDHAEKRLLWSHAFSSASIREYQPVLSRRAHQLVDELEKRARAGEYVNLDEWMGRFAFDFMGDMAFGGGFELMRDGDVDDIWHQMESRNEFRALSTQENQRGVAWQMHLYWATRLLLKFQFVSGPVVKFRNFTTKCAMQRQKNGSSSKDLFYHLINDSDMAKHTPSLDEIIANGELAIIAGSDTTSTTLSGAFFYLLTNPECYARLRAEMDAAFPPSDGDPLDATRLAEMKYLNAVINETMRLQPAVPTFLHRAPEKGTGGKWVREHFISEGTAVNVPPYVLHRDPRYFSPRTDEFWPDRWLHDPSTSVQRIITNTAAFIPFSAGNRNCAGKNLALAEMRMVIALLVQRFEMRFVGGFDIRLYEEGVVDKFITKVGKLMVVLKPRM